MCADVVNIEKNVAALFAFSASDKDPEMFVVLPFIGNCGVFFSKNRKFAMVVDKIGFRFNFNANHSVCGFGRTVGKCYEVV